MTTSSLWPKGLEMRRAAVGWPCHNRLYCVSGTRVDGRKGEIRARIPANTAGSIIITSRTTLFKVPVSLFCGHCAAFSSISAGDDVDKRPSFQNSIPGSFFIGL